MWKIVRSIAQLSLVVCVLMPVTARAALLEVAFQDALGDGSERGDVRDVVVQINNVTGAYDVTWSTLGLPPYFTSSDRPFIGDGDSSTADVRFILNLANQRLGTRVSLSATLSNVTLDRLRLYSGTDTSLTNWLVGDEIVTFGTVPAGSEPFLSSLTTFDGPSPAGEDTLEASGTVREYAPHVICFCAELGFGVIEVRPIDVSAPTDVSVPVPSSLLIFGGALALLRVSRRH